MNTTATRGPSPAPSRHCRRLPSVLPRRSPAARTSAPVRKDILTPKQKELALANALRYFPAEHHATLAPEFAEELRTYGRIYMYRFMPDYAIHARPIDHYPAKTPQAAAIMLMIQNNLDPAVAQHPEAHHLRRQRRRLPELGTVPLVMRYLSEMTEEQTLVMYSGRSGPVPLHPGAPGWW